MGTRVVSNKEEMQGPYAPHRVPAPRLGVAIQCAHLVKTCHKGCDLICFSIHAWKCIFKNRHCTHYGDCTGGSWWEKGREVHRRLPQEREPGWKCCQGRLGKGVGVELRPPHTSSFSLPPTPRGAEAGAGQVRRSQPHAPLPAQASGPNTVLRQERGGTLILKGVDILIITLFWTLYWTETVHVLFVANCARRMRLSFLVIHLTQVHCGNYTLQ